MGKLENKEGKKCFGLDPGSACHCQGAAGKGDSSEGSFAGFSPYLGVLVLEKTFFFLPWKKTHSKHLFWKTCDFLGKR